VRYRQFVTRYSLLVIKAGKREASDKKPVTRNENQNYQPIFDRLSLLPGDIFSEAHSPDLQGSVYQ